MKAPSTELHRKIWQMRPKAGGRRRKIWKASKGVWKTCNSLKSHKTAKDLFGKAWSKTREFWRNLEKAWRAPLFRHRWLLPPAASDRAGTSLRGAKFRSNPGVAFVRKRRSNEAVRPAKGGLSVWKGGWLVSSKGTGRRPVRNSQ